MLELIKSKKFLTTIVGCVVAVAARYGFNLDAELVAALIGLFATAVLGQGIADHGKEAAKIVAAQPQMPAQQQNVIVEQAPAAGEQTTVEMPGISSQSLADRVAARELAARTRTTGEP